MSEPSDERAEPGRAEAEPSDSDPGTAGTGDEPERGEATGTEEVEALRERVEEKYDFYT